MAKRPIIVVECDLNRWGTYGDFLEKDFKLKLKIKVPEGKRDITSNVLKINRCFECGREGEYDHHVIPRSLGGIQTLRLCGVCHGKVHNNKIYNISYLSKEGLKRAKARGVVLGRPSKVTEITKNKIKELRNEGWTIRKIAKELKMSTGVVWRISVETSVLKK